MIRDTEEESIIKFIQFKMLRKIQNKSYSGLLLLEISIRLNNLPQLAIPSQCLTSTLLCKFGLRKSNSF